MPGQMLAKIGGSPVLGAHPNKCSCALIAALDGAAACAARRAVHTPLNIGGSPSSFARGVIDVGSLAVSLAVLSSPPPETVALFVTLTGALAATFTVIVMTG
jgi:hypothetical protein